MKKVLSPGLGLTQTDLDLSKLTIYFVEKKYEGCQKSSWTPSLQLNRKND